MKNKWTCIRDFTRKASVTKNTYRDFKEGEIFDISYDILTGEEVIFLYQTINNVEYTIEILSIEEWEEIRDNFKSFKEIREIKINSIIGDEPLPQNHQENN